MYEKIITLYPELADFNFASGVITLQDDGQGAYIKEWNHPTLPRPTDDVLNENTSLTSLNRELA